MPIEQNLLNPDLRKERRTLLPVARNLLFRARRLRFDLGPPLQGVVTRAFEFLDSESSDDLPVAHLADRLEDIRQTLDEFRLSLEAAETEQFHRVTGQSGPGSGANQPMGPSSSPTAAPAPEAAPNRRREGEEQDEPAPTRAQKRKRGEGAAWEVPTKGKCRHFTHYVLVNMVHRTPTKEKRAALETSTGFWKLLDFFGPYRAAHPDAPSPVHLFNGKLPGGLNAFWGKARGIRQAWQEKRTKMEAATVNGTAEMNVDEWVEQQVLSFSGMTAEDRETWGQPATNAVTLPSTAFAPCPPCVLSFLRVLHFQLRIQQGPSLIVRAPAGRRRRSPRAFFFYESRRRRAFLSSSSERRKF